MLEPSAAEDKDTITCNKETVDKYGLTSIEDLAKVGDQITIGGPPEFAERAGFGIKALKRVYGAEFKKFQPLDVAGPLTVAALKDNKVQCANLFSTQSAIPANGFVTLEDPKGLVESEAVIPLITKEAATPEVTETLDARQRGAERRRTSRSSSSASRSTRTTPRPSRRLPQRERSELAAGFRGAAAARRRLRTGSCRVD